MKKRLTKLLSLNILKQKPFKVYYWFLFSTVSFVSLLLILITALVLDIAAFERMTLIIVLILFWAFLGIVFSIVWYAMRLRRESIKQVLDLDLKIEKILSISTAVSLIFYDDRGEIFWASSPLEILFNKQLIGKSVTSISPHLSGLGGTRTKEDEMFNFEMRGMIFRVTVHRKYNALVFKDVTLEEALLTKYNSEKLTVGELEIDNYPQLEVFLPSDLLFKIQMKVVEILDKLVKKHNISYRKYADDKFLLVLHQRALSELTKENFAFLDEARRYKVYEGVDLTLSLGFGVGAESPNEVTELARRGLLQSKSRGGDQITIMEFGKQPMYFGAKIEQSRFSSKVQVKFISKLIEDQLSDPSVKNVIIYGHRNADLDALGAAVAMAEFAKAHGRNAYIQNNTFDFTTQRVVNSLPKAQEALFVKPLAAKKIVESGKTIVFIVDTAELNRIENENALVGVDPSNIFVIDHHRASQIPASVPVQNMFIDTTASSASEIVCEIMMLSERNWRPSQFSAQMLLNGIYLDTKNFTKLASSRAFEAAAWLEGLGATPQTAVDLLKIPSEFDAVVRSVIASAREIKPGFFLSAYDHEISSDVISIICDEILRVEGRRAAFVIARIPGENRYKMSARSNDVNVHVIAEAVGGGGHFGSSAAISSEPLKVFVDNIVQAIVTLGGK